MRLPNGERAIVDIRKLQEYCLNPLHPRGRNKARVFARVGVHLEDAEILKEALASAAGSSGARPEGKHVYGERYIVDFDFARGGKSVSSTWIVRMGEDFPRLTSCYVL